MKKYLLCAVLSLSGALLCATAARGATEPSMASYSSLPIFQSASVMPNILILLDNSGSMNFPAYPDPYNPDVSGINNGTKLAGAVFKGAGCQIAVQVTAGNDDAEERLSDHAINYCSTDWRSHTTLDMSKSAYRSQKVNNKYCTEYAEQVTGIRFQGINVPRTIDGVPVVITSAQIVFTAAVTSANGNKATLYIAGQAADDAAGFTTAASNISGRAETAAKVTWTDVGGWTVDSQANATTPDLKAIVQEIINRPGWAAGNDMVFKITGATGSRRQAYSYNGSATKAPMLVIAYEPCIIQKYYGYFNADARYSYANGVFSQDASGEWDGNFLNWVSMRRVDVLRKALMGGKKPCESCNGKANLQGEVPAQANRYWQTYYKGVGVSPYYQAWYGVKDGKLYVKTTTDPSTGNNPWTSPDGTFVVEVAIDQEVEPELFCAEGTEAGNPCGIIQKVGEQARWGNIWYNDNNEGGKVSSAIGGGIRDIINDFQSTDMATSTPLAETTYTAMKYFAQQSNLPSGYSNSALPSPVVAGSVKDPFYDKGKLIPCAKSFLLMLTDGVPTEDKNIPASFQSYDGDTNATTRSYDSNGSDYLDDVALYAHVNDLRGDMEGTQTMDTYVIYAFGKDPEAKMLLMETAMNGGFVDRNGNKKPDGYLNNGVFNARPASERTEWDRNGDAIPDNFYDAQDGYMLEKQLLAAINAILNKAASGTAVSVLATTGEGEGTLVQAIFRPGISDGSSEVNWIGYLQSLWVDPKGNIREDSNKSAALEVDTDKIVSYYFDQDTKDTRVNRYAVSADDPYPDKDTSVPENISLEELAKTAIWEAGALLQDRPASDRKIYTYVGDGLATSSPMPFGTGSCIAFTDANAAQIKPFLGVQNNATLVVQPYTYLGATLDVRAANLINFIRGNDKDGDGVGGAGLQGTVSVRSRKISGKVWKLGDIVYSTPVTISKPVEKYGLIYDDTTYKAFVDKYANNVETARETVVYVGGNDGMLHAFTSGYYDAEASGFTQKNGTSERLGDELWAYIPRALLPHLKWLANPGYDSLVHVPYVDLKPKIIDVRIFADDDMHPGGWGTVLVGGMNFGGRKIWVNNEAGVTQANYFSSFFAIDITDPRHPSLLWDRWFPGLGLTINQPTVLQVGRTMDTTTRIWNSDDAWVLAIGSGFDDFNGWTLSGQKGSLYIVDIKTGTLMKQFQTAEGFAYMNTPIAIDKSLNYSVDALYIAGNYLDMNDEQIKSNIYRLGIPITSSPYVEGFQARYDKTPANWKWTKMVGDTGLRAVSAPFTISSDKKDNVWLYAGSGRYQVSYDKTDSGVEFLLGVKDPFYNLRGKSPADASVAYPPCYHSYTATACTVDLSSLFYANTYKIKPGNVVQPVTDSYCESTTSCTAVAPISSLTTWEKLLAEVQRKNTSTKWEVYQGWQRRLKVNAGNPSERMINKPTVLSGVAVFPAYTPNSDTCGFGGTSSLYALYYETGTAYKLPILTGLDNTQEMQCSADLGYGLSSSFGVHAAKERGGGATLYSQMSTGLINEIAIKGVYSNKDGVENWKEGR